MTTTSRARVEAYLQALATRDPDRIAPFLAADVDWLLTGPIETFPYCGQRSGREAVLDVYRLVAGSVRVTQHVRDHVLIEGERAATLARIVGVHESGREIGLRMATFTRFRGDMAAEICTVLDALGLVEQVLGRPLDIALDAPALAPATPEAQATCCAPNGAPLC